MKQHLNRFRMDARLHVLATIPREKRETINHHFYDVGVLAIEGKHPNQFVYDYQNFDVIPDANGEQSYTAKTMFQSLIGSL